MSRGADQRGPWKDPETAWPRGHPKAHQGKHPDSVDLGSAHWGSPGDPRDHGCPHTGAQLAEESALVMALGVRGRWQS